MGPPQGHFMTMNPMPSGSGPPGNMPPVGNQMYQPGGIFNRPQAGQMPMMPGMNPYQVQEFSLDCLVKFSDIQALYVV